MLNSPQARTLNVAPVMAIAPQSTTASRGTSKKGDYIQNFLQTAEVVVCRELKESNRVAFVPYLCAGDPNIGVTKKAIQRLDEIQADVIEVGVPYSDPLADGPVIQSSATRALQSGTTLNSVLEMLGSLTPSMQAPVVLFTYYNPIMARGIDTFCEDIRKAGVAGLLVPDIPLEETPEIREACRKVGVELVLLVTPTTPIDRMKEITDASEGFVYLVSRTGVTGMQADIQSRVKVLIETLHELTDKSVSVGFGVSGTEGAKKLVSWGAEGVIVGSAFVNALGTAPSEEEGLERMGELAAQIREVIP